MNTIKFQPIDFERTETHNVEVYETKKFIFDGREYDVYSNISLTIFVTNQCNANCTFCMNKYEKCFKNSEDFMNDDEYQKRLDYILNYIRPLKPSIAITGGEPSKSSRLPAVLSLIKKYGYKLKSFSTNGSGLLDVYEGKTVLQYMLENGINNNINLSRMSFDENINNKFMRFEEGYLSNEKIKTIAAFCNTNGMNLRMGAVLLKGGISNLEQILKYLSFYRKYNVYTAIFRELIKIDKDNGGYIKYADDFVDIDEIIREVEKNDDFQFIRIMSGMFYDVKVFKYKDYLVKIYKEKEPVKNVVRDLIFYTNGNLVNTDWNNPEEILLKYNRG